MKKIIIIAVASLMLGGASVWFFAPYLLPGHSAAKDSEHGKKAKAKDKNIEPEVGVDLDVFVVNLTGSATNRYLRTTLTVGVAGEHEKEKIKDYAGPIRHAVIMYLTEKKVEELTDPEGKNQIRGDLLKQINIAIGFQMVRNVYFKEFLIQ